MGINRAPARGDLSTALARSGTAAPARAHGFDQQIERLLIQTAAFVTRYRAQLAQQSLGHVLQGQGCHNGTVLHPLWRGTGGQVASFETAPARGDVGYSECVFRNCHMCALASIEVETLPKNGVIMALSGPPIVE
jgi:hypothetical protein